MDTTTTARGSEAVLTSDRLGEAWPEVSARLRRMLGSRGVDPTLNDDIVQEVAVRALDKRVPFTDPDDLYRWAATTARRLHIDHLRSDCRTTCDDDALLTVADGVDVAHAAERRVALGHVFRALAVMRPGERDAILESLEDHAARSSQTLVRRHRARATLRKAVGGVLTTLVGARLRLREAAPALRTASAAASMAPVVAIGSAGLFAAPPAQAPSPRPPAVAQATAPRAVAVAGQPKARPAAPAKAAPASRTRARAAAPLNAVPVHDPAGGDRPSTLVTVSEPPHNTPDGKRSVFCLEGDEKPIWCVPPLEDSPPPPDL